MRKSLFFHHTLCLFVFIELISHQYLPAQEKELCAWPRIGLNYRINPSFSIAGGLEWRLEDWLSRTDRWVLNVGLKYQLLPFLESGAGYELHYCNAETNRWNRIHCAYSDCILSTRLARWELSLRERFQYTVDGRRDEYRLRSRLKATYNTPRSICKPYALIEIYQGLQIGEHFSITRTRYWCGLLFTFTKDWTTNFYYCRQKECNSRKDIIGMEWEYSF